MDSISVNHNALVRQTSVDVINQCHCATIRCDSTPNDDDDDDDDEGPSEDADTSDDEEASVLVHGDITLAEEGEEEEVRVVPDSPEGGIICEGGAADWTQSHANVGVQTMTTHNAYNTANNSHRSSTARTLLTSICGCATRLTKERVIGSITIVVVVILMVLIEKMSGLELVDEKRIIQDLASQILPSQSSTTAAPSPPPPPSI
jgi:hypothetical protein